MSSIDQRIVQMRFDNAGFQNGVKVTLESLKQLNDNMKLKGAANGLNDLDRGIKNMSTSGLSSLAQSVDAISSRFSTMGIIATTALMNITNSAINTGKRMVSALTFEPITTGFSEYETKMGAIQTILTNTAHAGTTLKDVTDTLNELNLYADKTIYNFAEMTRNIGTFTAAGVDLETSTAAIKGIANLAAASGSTAQQASTAMYQLSQALAAGKVSLMDWNSVVNAGMGGKLFQDALIRTSQVLGTNAEGMIKKFGSFRESLTKGEWLTSEVLTETLKQLSGAYTEADLIAQGFSKSQAKQIVELAKNATAAATEVKTVTQLFDTMKESVQSGWAQSWEFIIGDKEQATKTLTSISDAFNNLIGPSTEARNTMLAFWNEAGGRDDLLKGLSNIISSVGKGLGAIAKGFRDVFPPMTGKQLVAITKGFKELTEKFKMSDKTASQIRSTFKGLFSILDIGKNAVVTLFKAFAPVTSVFGGISKALLSVTSSIGWFFSSINDAIKKSDLFGKIAKVIENAFSSIANFVENAEQAIANFFEAISKLDFKPLFEGIAVMAGGLGGGIGAIFGGLGKALGSINFDTIFKAINTFLAGGFLKTFNDLAKSMKGSFDSLSGIGESISGVLGDVRETLEAYQNNLNAGSLLKIASAIALLSGGLLMLSTIESSRLDSALSGITVMFIELVAALAMLMKISAGVKFKGFMAMPTMMLAFAGSIAILAVAMKNISSLDWEGIAKGIVGTTALMGAMVATTKLMSGSTKGIAKSSTGLIIFAAALNVMASAVEKLGQMSTETLIGGLSAIGVLLVELVAFMKLTDINKLGLVKGTGLLLLATSLNVLSTAVGAFGDMGSDGLIRGLSALGVILLELAAFIKLTGNSKGILTTSVAMIALSTAMNIMSGALRSFATVSWGDIASGLTAMAGSLLVMGMATKIIAGGKLIAISAGIATMGGALHIMSSAMKSLGEQSWEGIAKSLLSLATSLIVLGIAMAGMSGGIAGASAMLVMSAALALLTPTLMTLSKLSLPALGVALLSLAGAFTVLGLAGLVLTPVIPTLLGLAGAIALFGVSAASVGLGMSAFATGLALIATVGVSGGLALAEMFRQLINLLPQFGKKLGEGFVNMAGALGEGFPQFSAAMDTLFNTMIDGIVNIVPKIADAAVKLITAFAETIASAIPQLLDVGIKMVIRLAEGLTSSAYLLVDAAVELIVEFILAIANNLENIIQAGIELALSFIEGVATGISDNSPRLEGAIRSVIKACMDVGLAIIKGFASPFIEAGIGLVKWIIQGVKSIASTIGTAVGNAVSSAAKAVRNKVSEFKTVGKNIIQGLIDGVKGMANNVVKAAKGVVQGAIDGAKKLLGIHSPSRVFREIGKFTVQGFSVGLDKYGSLASKSSRSMAQDVIDSATEPLSKLSKIFDMDVNTNPVIKPVMDLSEVITGSKNIDKLINTNKSLQLTALTSGALSGGMGSIQNGYDNSDVVSALKDLKKSLSGNNVTYQVNGITYDDGSNVTNAVETLVRAAKIERRL